MTDRELPPPHDPVLRPDADDEIELDLGTAEYSKEPERPGGGKGGWWILLAVGLAICLLLGYWWWQRSEEPTPPPAVVEVEPVGEVEEAPTIVEDESEELEPLPPIEDSDAFIGNLLGELSASPLVADIQRRGNLVRRLVAAVENIAGGVNPAPHFGGLSPREPFRVVEGADGTRIDPRSYARFDRYAAAFGAMDAAEIVALLRRVEPLLDRAFQDLGYPGESFEDPVERAIARLRSTPVPEEPPRVRLDVTTYEFVDPNLEALSPAQKVLIRMGPENARRVIRKLGEVEQVLEGR
ncbi:MAG: DUF3014 domain-containing protein [Acidobacteriota bacterium]